MAVKGDKAITWSRPAGADLDQNQFAPLTVAANGDSILANVGSEIMDGILQNKPLTGEHVSIVKAGVTKMRAGGAVTDGRSVAIQSATFIAAVSGGQAFGKALETVTSGAIFTGEPLQSPHVLTTSLG